MTMVAFCGRILALGRWNLQMFWCKCSKFPEVNPSGMAADKCIIVLSFSSTSFPGPFLAYRRPGERGCFSIAQDCPATCACPTRYPELQKLSHGKTSIFSRSGLEASLYGKINVHLSPFPVRDYLTDLLIRSQPYLVNNNNNNNKLSYPIKNST